MKIAVIGTGNVGAALGRRWTAAGHEVVYGARDPRKPTTVSGPVATVREAASGAAVVLLAVPWTGASDALAAAGDLTGKVLLDATNPLTADLSGLTHGTTTSGGEEVARLAAGARVVKIFNTTGAGNMAAPVYGTRACTMLYCGDDAAAKTLAAKLAADVGFEPVEVPGGIAASRLLEPFALTWIRLAFGGLGTDFAFNLVRR